MSGFEVVGVVLGTIPLIISAVEHYERVIRTAHVLRRRAKVMHALALSLRTEQRILENTCETLLGGIVSAGGIKPLLAEPFGPLWQDDKIRLEVERRLDYTEADFRNLVKAMMEALQELRMKLDLGSDMEVQKDESTVAMLKIAMTISQHEEAVNKIADTNRKLETLLHGSLRNESFRRQTSKSPLFTLLQALSWSIYNAVQLSLPCICAPSHCVNLGLPAPRPMSKRQDVESIVRDLDFHLAFANEPRDSKGKGRSNWAWDEVLLRMADWTSKTTQPHLVPVCPTPKTMKAKNSRVRFAEDLPLVSSMQSPSETLIQASTQLAYPLQNLTLQTGEQGREAEALIRPEDVSREPRQLSNLCDSFGKKLQGQTPRGCYGYITDGSSNASRRFRVYHLHSADDNDTCFVVSLRDLLERRLKPPSLFRRHHIAAVVAASILNLHGTPWMPLKLTAKDLYFIQRHGNVEYDKIFVTKKLSDDVSVAIDTSRDDSDNYDGNPSLHALGVLLMEVMLWKSIHDFWDDVNPRYSQTPAQVLLNIRSDSGFKRTSSVLERIRFSGGPAYRDAVEHCIKCDLGCDLECLDDDDFRNAVYHHIVAPLQDAAHIIAAPMTAGKGQFAHTS